MLVPLTWMGRTQERPPASTRTRAPMAKVLGAGARSRTRSHAASLHRDRNMGVRSSSQQDELENAMIQYDWGKWKVPLCLSYHGLFAHDEVDG